MSRRYKRNTKLFSKREKQFFYLLYKIVKTFFNIIVAIIKAIPEIANDIRKMIRINQSLRGVGYSYPEILDKINTMSPRQFEIFCAELFKNSGRYTKVEVTQATCDMGRDIILTAKINGFEETTFVECKHWDKNKTQIGREIAMKLLGSCSVFNVEKAIIITTGTYHKNAYEVAGRVNNLQLMDITDIQKMLLDLDSSQISKIMLRTLNAS